MKSILIILCVLMGHVGMKAQEQRVVTGTLWQNWFVQAGLDMSLQNPYQCNFSEVFPKGKTFGVDVALGKWFTPHVALRGKVNWENGLSIFKNNHLEWGGDLLRIRRATWAKVAMLSSVWMCLSVSRIYLWIMILTNCGISMFIQRRDLAATLPSIRHRLQWVSE